MKSLSKLWIPILICAVGLLVGVPAVSPALAATDVSGHWAARDMEFSMALGAMRTAADGGYHPDRPVTRAEAVAMIISGLELGFTPPGEPRDDMRYPSDVFSDVDGDHWFAAYAHAAADTGIVAGYPDGTFHPEASITRAELAVIMHRAFEDPGIAEGSDPEYSDAEDLPEWSTEAVQWVEAMGFMLGFPDGSFLPGELMTRAEAATLLRRMVEYRGNLFDIRGRVIDRSSDGSRLEVLLDDGNITTLQVEDARAYRGRERIFRRDVVRGDTVGVLLDSRGQVIWLEALNNSILGTIDRLDFTNDAMTIIPWEPGGSGELAASAEMAFWSAAGRPEIAGEGADPIELYWTGSTKFYRQGVEAASSFLRPGDRVYAHLGPGGPELAAVDAVRYDAWGEVTGIEDAPGTMHWAGLDGAHSAAITPNTRIEYAGRRVSPREVDEGMYVGVALSRDGGDVLYAEVYDRTMPGLLDVAALDGGPDTDWRSNEGPSNPEIIGISSLKESIGVTGAGVTVAIVDTGVDPRTRSLWSSGGPNLIDWKDFSGSGSLRQRIVGAPASRSAEGDVFLGNPVNIEDRNFEFEGSSFRVTGRMPADGHLRVGWLHPEALGLRSGSSLLVAAGRSEEDGDYDLVFIDTDGDGLIRSREIFRPLDRGGSPGTLMPEGEGGSAINFVVAELDRRGEGVNLGYDGNGHGTQVACSVASTAGDHPPGTAPGVDIMALKALSSSGSGTWEEVIRAARYAAENGADIINISVTGAQDLSAGGSRESRLLREIAERYGVLIITASGNTGPGLATAFTPGDVRSTLIVGAASIPEIVARDYGYALEDPGVWGHSSIGPRADGALAPSVLGPASAYVHTAEHIGSGEPVFFEGTSCAAAHVTGLAALMVEGARERGLDYAMSGVKRAIEVSARSLPGYLAVEQGFGLIDPQAAWRTFSSDPRGETPFHLGVDYAALVERPYVGGDPGGVYLRSMEPGSLNLTLTNLSGDPQRIILGKEDLPSAVVPDDELTLPGGGEISIPAQYLEVPEGSMESGFIVARSVDNPSLQSWLLHTIVNPVRLGPDRPDKDTAGSLPPGGWKRYFVEVPDGASELQINLGNPGGDTGRIMVQLVDPDGVSAYTSPYIGAGSHDRSGSVDEVVRSIQRPRPGVWEVNVSSSPSLSFYGLAESLYDLRISLVADQGVILLPDRREWRFAPGETPQFSDVNVDLEMGADVDPGTLDAYGYGWFPDDRNVRLVPREWVEHRPGEAHYREIEVADRTESLVAWAKNSTDNPGSAVDVYIYAYDEYGSVVPKSEGEGYAQLASPDPGRYLVVARSGAEERSSFEFGVDAWPADSDIRVYRLGSSHGNARLVVRLGAPLDVGRYSAVVGVRDEGSGTMAEATMRVEVGGSEILMTVALGRAGEEMVVSVRLPDGRVAPGALLLEGKIYSLDAAGRAFLPVPAGSGRSRSARVRYGSPEGDWSTPVDLEMAMFTREQMMTWRSEVLPGLQGGGWTSPLAARRLSGILSGM